MTDDGGLFPGPTAGYRAVAGWSAQLHGRGTPRHRWALMAAATMDESGPDAELPRFPSRIATTRLSREERARQVYRGAGPPPEPGTPLRPQPGMRHTITLRAGPGERFMPGCFDSQVGEVVPLTYRDTDDGPVRAQLGMGKVVSAIVADDGCSVFLTYEVVSAVEHG